MNHAGKTFLGVKLLCALLHNTRFPGGEACEVPGPLILLPELNDVRAEGLRAVNVGNNGRVAEDRTEKLNSGPILVVCLTNHALDSFLEGLLDAGVLPW